MAHSRQMLFQEVRLKAPKSPLRIIFMLNLFVIMVAAMKLIESYNHNTSIEVTMGKLNEMNNDERDILLAFEMMEHAVQIASFSGQLSWENKYYDAVDSLEVILRKYPDMQVVQKIIAAKNEILLMDKKIFQLIRDGKLRKSIDLVFSLEHERAQYHFKLAGDHFAEEIDRGVLYEINLFRSSYLFSVFFVLALVILLIFSFLIQYRLSKRWMNDISSINTRLDEVVRQRTQTLNDERMKRINASRLASLGVMSAGIAHEINNPLAIISGKAASLKNMATKGNLEPADVLSIVDKTQQMVKRISKIIHGLKSFSRDASHDPFERIELSQLIEDTQSVCQERLKHHGMELHVPIVPKGLTVECRPSEIGQVLVNLINNAHDAILHLPERWVKLEVKPLGATIEISVTDSGSGIPEDLIGKIMDPFFTTKEVGKGTGLGLSISKGIIEAHKGEFYIDTSSKNTRFVIQLPAIQNAKKVA